MSMQGTRSIHTRRVKKRTLSLTERNLSDHACDLDDHFSDALVRLTRTSTRCMYDYHRRRVKLAILRPTFLSNNGRCKGPSADQAMGLCRDKKRDSCPASNHAYPVNGIQVAFSRPDRLKHPRCSSWQWTGNGKYKHAMWLSFGGAP